MQSGTYLWVTWMEIATAQLRAAERARTATEGVPAIGGEYLTGLDRELAASLVAIVVAGHALDAFGGSVAAHLDFPAGLQATWQKNGTKRSARILETLKLAFEIGPRAGSWDERFRQLFDRRDFGVHHRSELRPMVPHATGRTQVSHESSVFCVENARDAVELAVEVMTTCMASPRATQRRIADWAPEAAGYVDVVRGSAARS
jgi:hypothetical protein